MRILCLGLLLRGLPSRYRCLIAVRAPRGARTAWSQRILQERSRVSNPSNESIPAETEEGSGLCTGGEAGVYTVENKGSIQQRVRAIYGGEAGLYTVEKQGSIKWRSRAL